MLNDTTEMQSANPEDRSPYKTDTSFLNKEAEDVRENHPRSCLCRLHAQRKREMEGKSVDSKRLQRHSSVQYIDLVWILTQKNTNIHLQLCKNWVF